MIFGSNVGTSVTNTIVSMTQAGDRETFRRAFAAATVHDMFNWLSVCVLLFLEMSTGFLEYATGEMVKGMPLGEDGKGANVTNPDLLKPITKPFTNNIVQLDKKVLLGWSFKDSKYDNVTTLIKLECKDNKPCTHLTALLGGNGLGLSDTWVGLFLLAFSLILLCGCLITLMKILNSLLKSQMAGFITKTINADIPYCPWLTGYLGILIGKFTLILLTNIYEISLTYF